MKTRLVTITRSAFLSLAAAAAAAPGCTSDQVIRARAEALRGDIATFKSQEQDFIKQLNAEYRDTYDALISQLQEASDQQAALNRSNDAERNADAIMTRLDETTLPGAFRDMLLKTIQGQREEIKEVNERMEAARATYALKYKAVKANLDKLEEIRTKLEVLAREDSELETAALVLRSADTIYETYKATVEKAKKDVAGGKGK